MTKFWFVLSLGGFSDASDFTELIWDYLVDYW